jgi:hypothetical protein
MFASDTRRVLARSVEFFWNAIDVQKLDRLWDHPQDSIPEMRDAVRTVSHHVRYASSSDYIVWFHPALHCSSLERKSVSCTYAKV